MNMNCMTSSSVKMYRKTSSMMSNARAISGSSITKSKVAIPIMMALMQMSRMMASWTLGWLITSPHSWRSRCRAGTRAASDAPFAGGGRGGAVLAASRGAVMAMM